MSGKNDVSLPSYEDCVNTKQHRRYDWNVSEGQGLLDALTLARAAQVRSVIDEEVWPVLEQQALQGLAKTTVALIPSESIPQTQTKSDYDSESDRKVLAMEPVGFPSEENVQLVQLQSTMGSSEFWRQDEAIAELEKVLVERLGASSLHIHMLDIPAANPVVQVAPKKQKRSFFWKGSDSKAEAEITTPSQPRPPGRFSVNVRPEEICMRTESQFGLYDTINSYSIVIRVNIR